MHLAQAHGMLGICVWAVEPVEAGIERDVAVMQLYQNTALSMWEAV